MLLQLALHFVELYFDEEQQRVFDVKVLVNKQLIQALTNFDIYHEAGDALRDLLSCHARNAGASIQGASG